MGKEMYLMLICAIAGIGLSLQGPMNSTLTQSIKSPLYSSLVNFIAGVVVLSLIIIFKRESIPSVGLYVGAPWWAYLSGFIGIFFIVSLSFTIPTLGTGTAVGIQLVFQLITAVVVDSFGFFGMEAHEISFPRIIGILLMLGGIFLIQKY